jgi:hypothetical protein
MQYIDVMLRFRDRSRGKLILLYGGLVLATSTIIRALSMLSLSTCAAMILSRKVHLILREGAPWLILTA